MRTGQYLQVALGTLALGSYALVSSDCLKKLQFEERPITDEERTLDSYVSDEAILKEELQTDMVPGIIRLSLTVTEDANYIYLKGLHLLLEDEALGLLELAQHGRKEPHVEFFDSYYLTEFPDDIEKITMVWNEDEGVKNLFFRERGTQEDLPVVATEIY